MSRKQETSPSTDERAYHFLRKLQSESTPADAALFTDEPAAQSSANAPTDIDDFLFKRAEVELRRARSRLEELTQQLVGKT